MYTNSTVAFSFCSLFNLIKFCALTTITDRIFFFYFSRGRDETPSETNNNRNRTPVGYAAARVRFRKTTLTRVQPSWRTRGKTRFGFSLFRSVGFRSVRLRVQNKRSANGRRLARIPRVYYKSWPPSIAGETAAAAAAEV